MEEPTRTGGGSARTASFVDSKSVDLVCSEHRGGGCRVLGGIGPRKEGVVVLEAVSSSGSGAGARAGRWRWARGGTRRSCGPGTGGGGWRSGGSRTGRRSRACRRTRSVLEVRSLAAFVRSAGCIAADQGEGEKHPSCMKKAESKRPIVHDPPLSPLSPKRSKLGARPGGP